MKTDRRFVLAWIVGLLITGGCSGIQPEAQNNLFNSTLWTQTASEHKAHAIQVYNTGKMNIDKAIRDKAWTAVLEQKEGFSSLPPAVVLDIDETVLDNSRYQARLLLDGTGFSPATWDKWVSLKSAPALPGAVDFINTTAEKNVEVIYITNRQCSPRATGGPACPQEQDTLDNLKRVGILNVKPENILLKREQPDWSSEKKSRREAVVSKYRVVMLFGDDLGDFLPGVKKNITPGQRDALVEKHGDNWGYKWYMLSNPGYGSWLRVLDDPKSKHLTGY